MNKNDFGNFIRELRNKKGYTQKELADLLYIDVSAVSKWERGISFPDITLIPKICEVLDTSEHELIESSYDLEYQKIKEEGLKFINIKNKVFWTSTFLYLLAIIICFIVNICVNKKLSWFFIVLISCLTSFAFFPTFTRFFKKNKFLIFIGTSFTSLVLLYLTCSIYTNNYWWIIASLGTLLGYFLIFYPIIYFKKIIYLNENYLQNKKYFLISYGVILLLLTLLLIISINFYTPITLNKSLIIASYSFTILIIYGLINFLKINKYFIISIDLFLTNFYLFGLGKVLTKLLGNPDEYGYKINFYDWKHYTNGNVVCIIMLIILILSTILLIIGILKSKNKKM